MPSGLLAFRSGPVSGPVRMLAFGSGSGQLLSIPISKGPLSPSAGGQTYPAGAENTADLVRLELWLDGDQVKVEQVTLFQNRDFPVLNEYRSVLGGLFKRCYGFSNAQIAKIFPDTAPKDIQLL